MGLLTTATLVPGCASTDGRLAAGPTVAGACAQRAMGDDTAHRVLVDADCGLRVLGADNTVVAELDLRPTGRETVRRIVPVSSVLFVLRADPGRLEAYRLPTLQPLVLVGGPSLRAPADLAFRVDANDSFVGYVLDNPSPYSYHDSDLPSPQSEVLRFALRLHDADERQMVVAAPQGSFTSSTASGRRVLERVDLLPNEVRVVVREDRHRYAEYFTDDGVLLERVRMVDGAFPASPN